MVPAFAPLLRNSRVTFFVALDALAGFLREPLGGFRRRHGYRGREGHRLADATFCPSAVSCCPGHDI